MNTIQGIKLEANDIQNNKVMREEYNYAFWNITEGESFYLFKG